MAKWLSEHENLFRAHSPVRCSSLALIQQTNKRFPIAMESKQVDEVALLKEEYLQALARNTEARLELKQVLKHSTDQCASKASSRIASRLDCLTAHLDRVRIERQYGDLQTMAHYFDESEAIARDENLYDPLGDRISSTQINPTHNIETGRHKKVEETQQRVRALLDSAKTLTTNLELALVRARQQLKREKLLLEYAKAQSEGNQGGGNMDVKLKALEITRTELQAWIGDSLAACERKVTLPNPELLTNFSDGGPVSTLEESGSEVDNEYSRYIVARTGLVVALRALRSRLPALASDELPSSGSKTPFTASQAPTTQRPMCLRYKSHTSDSRPIEHSTTSSLAEIQSIHLPEYYHEKLLSTYMAHLESQTLALDARLLQVLNLLSHESHLLPTYPLPSMQQSQMESANNLNQQQFEVDCLLRRWAFASGAASEALDLSVQNNVQEAKGALEKANASIEEMHLIESMRKEVLEKP